MISSYPDCFRAMPMMPSSTPMSPGMMPGCMPMPMPMPMPAPMPAPMQMPMNPSPQMPQNTPMVPSTMDNTMGAAQESPFEMAPGSPVQQDINYTQGYLRTQIGKRVRITFLLGTGTLQDRTGILENVGISYVIIRNLETNSKELADIYSIKFVEIFDRQ